MSFSSFTSRIYNNYSVAVFLLLRVGRSSHKLGPVVGPVVELLVTGAGRPIGDFGDESCVALGDFAWRRGDKISVEGFRQLMLSSQGSVLPYCTEPESRAVIFAKCDPKHIAEGTFMYQAQRCHATKLYAISFEQLTELTERCMQDEPEWAAKVMFVQSTGRCGSTLVSKLLNKVGSVVSLSEPDVYLSLLGWLAIDGGHLEKSQLHRLLRAFTYCLTLYRPNQPLAIKFRSQQILQACELKEAMPKAKQIYLYRNAVDTVDSFGMAFLSSKVLQLIRLFRLDSLYIYQIGFMPRYFSLIIPTYNTINFPAAVVQPLGFIGFLTLSWISNVDSALKALARNPAVFDTIVTYECLIEHRLTVIRRLLDACGLQTQVPSDHSVLSKVFDEDAHSPTVRTASSKRRMKTNKSLYIPDTEMKGLLDLVARHPTIKTPNFQLPGTMRC